MSAAVVKQDLYVAFSLVRRANEVVLTRGERKRLWGLFLKNKDDCLSCVQIKALCKEKRMLGLE